MKRVSVAMTTYNGEEYLKEQLDSILKNLSLEDEIIISDDGSQDKTIQILDEYCQKDSRIQWIQGPRQGVKQNFANAISHCNGKYIFLADQDDVWYDNKVETVVPYLDKYAVVIHDCIITNSKLEKQEESFFAYRNSGKGIFKNIYKNTYIGCCMAFHRDLIPIILPIPNNIEMHDQWIGVLGENKKEGSLFLQKKLLLYRRHETNTSSMKHYPLKKMLLNRYHFMKEY